MIWNIWSRYWVKCTTSMLRWHLGKTGELSLPDASLTTRVGREGVRWAVLARDNENIIHIRRRSGQRLAATTQGAGSAPIDTTNNVVPFISSYLRRANAR
jgi:hypothetical protein